MKSCEHTMSRAILLALMVTLCFLPAPHSPAQLVPLAPAQSTPMAQRNAMNLVLNQIRWFQNSCGSAGSYAGGGFGILQQQFQAVRDQYSNFKTTLNAYQANTGGNQIAELDAGLDIIQEAFADYQTSVANGQSPNSAYSNLRQVLSQAMRVWSDQFKQTCNQLRVGW